MMKSRRWSGCLSVFVCIGSSLATAPALAAEDGWYMSGANPQRTSWVPAAATGRLVPSWYRPIEGY